MAEEQRSVPAPPEDPELPRVAELFHQDSSSGMLSRFLRERGWEFEDSWVIQAIYRPTRACTVRFKVLARQPSGVRRYISMCLETRTQQVPSATPPPDFARRFGIEDPVEDHDGIRAWVFPYDPALPHLPDAAHGPTMRDAACVQRPAAVSVTPLRYRPGQRAVFRYNVVGLKGAAETLYGKVVHPDAFRRIFDAFRSYERTGIDMVRPRAAEGLDGVAVFPMISGTCLRDAIEAGGALPDPSRVVDLLERLAKVPWLGDPDPGNAAYSMRISGRLLAHIVPQRRDEIRALYRSLAARLEEPLPETFTVHGDLYEGQIFIGDDFRLGLIDLEDGGPGDPLMDAGNMLAHLRVFDAYAPDAEGRPIAYRAMLREALLEHLGGGDEELAWREAVAALHLATGPFRVQSPDWPAETEQRLDEVLDLMQRSLVDA